MVNSHDAGESGAAPTTETWPEYVRRISGGATQAQIAERIGVGRLSVCNWLHGKTHPKAETVIIVARAYLRSPIEALIAASYLATDEAGDPIDIRVSLADIIAGDLGAEVQRRLTTLEAVSSAGAGQPLPVIPQSRSSLPRAVLTATPSAGT
jgi:transcriptional regulator with XRE-family HTH domain